MAPGQSFSSSAPALVPAHVSSPMSYDIRLSPATLNPRVIARKHQASPHFFCPCNSLFSHQSGLPTFYEPDWLLFLCQGSLLRPWHDWIHSDLTHHYSVSIIPVPTLQMRKLRHGMQMNELHVTIWMNLTDITMSLAWKTRAVTQWGEAHIRISIHKLKISVCSVQSFSHIQLFVTPWTAAHKSLFITNSQNLLKLKSIESVMPSNHLILCCPFLLPPSIFPSIGVFSKVSSSHQVGQSVGVSALASVLPMNIQDWFPLGLTGLISLQSVKSS